MTFKQFLRATAKKSRLKKKLQRKKVHKFNTDNYTGKNNYINTPTPLPSKQVIGGFPDSSYAGFPSA
jgi:hypothetical protein